MNMYDCSRNRQPPKTVTILAPGILLSLNNSHSVHKSVLALLPYDELTATLSMKKDVFENLWWIKSLQLPSTSVSEYAN